ncbi:MAG: energy transducer TonB [Bacteroidota bacterium]
MTAALVNRPNIPYGARQFQEYIGKSTYRAFFITLSLMILAVLAFSAAAYLNSSVMAIPSVTNYPIVLKPYTTAPPAVKPAVAEPKAATPQAPATKSIKTPTQVLTTRPVPVATPVEPISSEPIASNNNTVGTNSPGTETNPGGTTTINAPGGSQSGTNTIPDKWDFNPVEKEPVVNLAQLSKNVNYPDFAKRQGIEGKVMLRVLIGQNGKAVEVDVIDSRYEILSKAAIEAVLKTQFTPAMQNGQAVNCWISIPVDFKLR